MGDFKEKEEASDGVEDMIKLSDLSEKSLLTNLQVRYDKHQIYTYIGSILVAVNPYRMFNIYGLDMVKKYDGQPLGALPPHLFAIGSTSFNKMVKDNENQVVVISGESGAGKTESTKLLMQYLAAVNKSGNNLITEQILEANPLLESFGNAKTIRNDNSSRFGKYIEVFFKGGSIVGAKISEYLLEKSRIVTQASNERNYHVFYEILNGLSKQEKADYGLTTSDKYFYLNQGGNCDIDTRDDTENYSDLIAAMDVLNFSRFEQDTIKKLLASVLHMGNVYFDKIQGPDNHEVVELGTDAEVKWVSHLLGLATDWLTQALTSKVTEARGERLFTPYNIEQALDARDAIAKALYSRLFSWLVERVNSIISKSEKDKSTSLAVLDIFGFEDFYKNSFEQLCINYANETLQFFFNQHIFKQEQKEYSKEGIDWSYIVFKDNQPVIDIISAKPSGILHILDDECNFPQSTDHSFLEKCHFNHGDSDLYEKPRMSDPQFSIFHYAGKIKYNVISFLEKNKDTLRSGVIELLCESKNQMITQMFNDMRDRHITKTVSKSTGKFVTLKPRTPTVAANFHESLLSLIDTMSRCNPYFVRCIKPNDTKAPMLFDGEVVLDQLRYTGMLETIRIRKMGYTIRIRFTTFIDRYRCILRGQKILTGSTLRDICSMILKTMGEPYTEQYQLGSTKVFMKEPFEQHLDRTALKIQKDAVIRIQKVVRMFLARKRFQDMYSASARIQAVIRTFLTRKRYRVIQSGVIKAQAQYRMQRQRLKYIRAREQFRSRLDQERLLQQQRLEREKMEKEQRERAAKTLSNLANMEITAELAFVYSKLEEWNPPHHDRHLYTMTGEVTPIDMKYRLPSDVNSFPFSKYTSVYFRDADWGMRIEPLKTTLTSVSGDDNVKHALTVFKLILRFMHDHNMTERKEKLLSDYIVQQGLKNDAIRDEIYCQIVNQIWKNEKSAVAERGWILLANCLSCFSPSHTLFKYLLKFVSDHGHNGFKAFCQHKVLQCANIGPELCRVYPPSLLEWKAALLKYGMALDVQFADGKSMYGHVESWTSGELFTSHLLNLRGLQENNSGWTVCLQEDKDYYELLGYDYVLDLISEMEIPPNFPHGKSYFIVSSKHGRDSSVIRRSTAYSHSPHHPDTDRTMFIRGDLPEPLTVDTTAVMRGVRRSPKADELQFSMTSKLNQRPTEIQVDGLSHNRLNARYNKRLAPTPPLSNGNILNGNVLSTTLATDVRQDTDLARTKLNKRYHNGATDLSPTQNGEPLSNHMLNNRYMKSNVKTKSKAGASEQILRQKRTDKLEKAANMSEDSAVTPHSDWSHWVEDVFNNALHEHDAQSEPRSLEQRIKGGGKGVPGVQSQQTVLPGAGLLNNYATTPLTSPLLLPNVGGGSNELLQQQLMLLQAAQQQQAQQQAAQQAVAQQAAQQQALLQLQQQQKAQQQTALQSALHQQQLENRLLQESIQQQVLRNQLQQLQNNSVSPDSSFNSGLNQPSFQTTTQTNTVMNGMAPKAGLPNSISLATNETGKKVYKIESSLANKRIHNAPPVVGNKPQVNGDVMASTIKHYQFPPPGPEKNITVSSPPPPPPKTFVDISAQRQLHSPPPPPPPPVNYIQEESVGTFSFGDEEGRAKTVKVGKVVWPPPVMGQKKKELDVGRLDIDENMRQSLEDKVSPKKKWTKPEPPPETDKGPKSILKTKDQEVKKTKSLSETMHMATLKLLEQKLGGVSTATETEPLPEPKPSTSTTIETETDFRPPSPPSRPPPKKPLVTEETQTTATLHKSQKIGIDFTDSPKENIYSTKIVGPDTGIYETHIKRDREPSGKYNTEIKHAPPPDIVYEQQIKPSVDYAALEKVATQLFAQNKEQFLTYRNVPWTINVRKEVFSPCERLENQLALHLIFCQIVQDVYDSGCIRINKELRVKMRGMLESYGVNDDNYLTKNFKPQIKKIIIDTAKEWPVYFSRLFPVASSGHYSNIKYVGVSHSGIRLVTREKSLVDDYLDVHEYFRFEDVIDVVLPTRTTLQLNLKTKSIVFFTNRARQLKELIDVYCVESEKGNRYVIALKDYITKDATLLSFRRGDVIKLLEDDISTDRSGWLYGTTEGRIGWFPDNIIKVLARHEVDSAMVLKAEFLPKPKPKVRVVELPPLSPKPKPVVVPVQRPPTPPPPSPPPQPVVVTRYELDPPQVQDRVSKNQNETFKADVTGENDNTQTTEVLNFTQKLSKSVIVPEPLRLQAKQDIVVPPRKQLAVPEPIYNVQKPKLDTTVIKTDIIEPPPEFRTMEATENVINLLPSRREVREEPINLSRTLQASQRYQTVEPPRVQERVIIRQEISPVDDRSEASQGTIIHDGKYSMMEFAMLNFRESLEKYETLQSEDGSIRGTVKMIENAKQNPQLQGFSTGSSEWTWKEQADMIKWTRSPIPASLLRLPSSELNKLAIECFVAIMQFMGDYPLPPEKYDFDCVIQILRNCHKYPELRDEVYCQLCKQTTSNKSMKPKSCVKGWRLFSIVASYCDCSETLHPYLFKYLEDNAADTSRSFNGPSAVCLQNLRKTFRYGGRKNVPLKEEIAAIADGRISKRIPYIFGGTPDGGVLHIKSCTVVRDCLEEVCNKINIVDPVEMEEYTLFLHSREESFSSLNRDDYLLDVTAEYARRGTDFDLLFQRTVWYFPVKQTDNEVYIDFMFGQCLPDYLEGLNVILPREGALRQEDYDDICLMAALLYRGYDRQGTPTMQDLKDIVPKFALENVSSIRPQQWLNRIHDYLRNAAHRSSIESKMKFIDVLSGWLLFGATFFKIDSIPGLTGNCLLAINRDGIRFLKTPTHEPIIHHSFSQILSTRRYRSDSGVNYLDMKLGDLMVQKITRIQTDQGSDISSLIGQYMQVSNKNRKRPDRNLTRL